MTQEQAVKFITDRIDNKQWSRDEASSWTRIMFIIKSIETLDWITANKQADIILDDE